MAILHQATDRSLVLMDEIGRGTATYDGLSLAGAIAEELVSRTRSLTLFATHYFELTQLAARVREVANVHVSASHSKNRIIFLHEIEEGPASRSYGIAVAQLAGIPSAVVRRAKAMLQKLEKREESIASPQPDLFGEGLFLDAPDTAPLLEEAPQPDPALAEFADDIAAIDIDNLSPREAFAKLSELHDRARQLREGQSL